MNSTFWGEGGRGKDFMRFYIKFTQRPKPHLSMSTHRSKEQIGLSSFRGGGGGGGGRFYTK